MKHILYLFREDNGNLSINRVIFAIGMIWVMVITSYIIIAQDKQTEATTFFSVTAGVFTSLKLIQKGIENYKSDKPKTNDTNSMAAMET